MWFKFNSLAIIRTVSRRSDRTRARTISTLLSVFEVEGLPERGASLMDSQPSGFPKFDTKLDCTSLLEIALFNFRDTHTHTILLHK